jgi:hypothetical protein
MQTKPRTTILSNLPTGVLKNKLKCYGDKDLFVEIILKGRNV